MSYANNLDNSSKRNEKREIESPDVSSCSYNTNSINSSKRRRIVGATDNHRRECSTFSDEEEEIGGCQNEKTALRLRVSANHNPISFRPATWNTVRHPTIVVSFNSLDDAGLPTYELWLHNTDVAVHKQSNRRGTIYLTSLTELLPAVGRNNGSMKVKSGYIYRPGIVSSHSFIYIGTLDDISSNNRHPSLKIAALDEIVLKELDAGIFTCSLFYEDSKGNSKEYDIQDNERSSVPECSELLPSPTVSPQPNVLKCEFKNDTEKFVAFLRDELGIPHEKEWPRAEYISDVLARYLEIEEGIKKLKGWVRGGKGGYQVPKNHKSEFRGTTFTRTSILTAFKTGASKYSGDRSHFATANLANSPTARAWVENPNGKHSELFARMTIQDFTRFVVNESRQSNE